MVYTICIGSNEHRQRNMAYARRRLSELFPGIRFSTEEETLPLQMQRQELFSNQVARFQSDTTPDAVKQQFKRIEQEAGRCPEEKAAGIVRLDIDLIACDTTVYKPEDLQREYIRRGIRQLDKT